MTHVDALLAKWAKRYWELRENRRMAQHPIDQEDVMDEAMDDLRKALELDRKEKDGLVTPSTHGG